MNTRKQDFKAGDNVVVMHDIKVKDLAGGFVPESATAIINDTVVPAGTFGIVRSFGYALRVQFEVFNKAKANLASIRSDGQWTIDPDLVQLAANKSKFVPHTRAVMPFGRTTSWRSLKPGLEVEVLTPVDRDGDVYVAYEDDDAERRSMYMRWYELVVADDAKPTELIWGVVPNTFDANEGKRVAVVAVRDITRADYGSTGDRQREVVAYKGQVGHLETIFSGEDRNALVYHFDASRDYVDFWRYSHELWQPLLDFDTGKPMLENGTAFQPDVEVDDLDLFEEGQQVEIFGSVYELDFTKNPAEPDFDKVSKLFRDGDKVYIVEVDEDAARSEYDELIYRISHTEDDSSASLWVRDCDLVEIE